MSKELSDETLNILLTTCEHVDSGGECAHKTFLDKPEPGWKGRRLVCVATAPDGLSLECPAGEPTNTKMREKAKELKVPQILQG